LPRALLQFVYPAAAVVFDRLVCGRALSVAQLAGVALMAEALIGVKRGPSRSGLSIASPEGPQ